MSARRLTVTEISERICVADGLRLADHEITYSRVRNAVRQGFLEGGEVIAANGTLAFPTTELHRARILTAVAAMTADIKHIGPIIARAANEARPASVPTAWPERTKVDGGYQWRGFADVVAGVQAGERWTLEIALHSPARGDNRRLTARFYEGDDDSAQVDSIFGTRKLGRLTFDLADLFAGLDS